MVKDDENMKFKKSKNIYYIILLPKFKAQSFSTFKLPQSWPT